MRKNVVYAFDSSASILLPFNNDRRIAMRHSESDDYFGAFSV